MPWQLDAKARKGEGWFGDIAPCWPQKCPWEPRIPAPCYLWRKVGRVSCLLSQSGVGPF